MALPTTTNTARPRSQGFNLRINDLLLRLIETQQTPLDITTSEDQQQRLNTNENPEDFSPVKGTVFSRSSFYGGEGLAFAHRPNNTELDRTRFWDSNNINIERENVADIPSLKLSRKLDRQDDITSADAYLDASDTTLFLIEGNTVKWTADALDTPPSWTIEDPMAGHAGNLVSIAILNDDPYVVLNGHGVHRRVSGVWVHWSDRTVDSIFSLKERIFGISNSNLYEVRAGVIGDSVLIHSLEAGKRWISITSVGPAILATASDGNVYTFTFATDEETFDLILFSRTKIAGEVPQVIAALHEEILLTTSATNSVDKTITRLYRCKLTENLTLTRTLIKEWGSYNSETYNTSSITQPKFSFATDRSSFYFMLVENTTGTDYMVSVWRYNIIENALSRVQSKTFTSLANRPQFRGTVRHKSRLFFTMYSDVGLTSDAQGLWWGSSTYNDEGYLITPLADFFTAVEKVWVTIGVDALSSSGAETVEIHYTTNPVAITDPLHSDWRFLTTIIATNISQELRVRETKGRYLAMKVVLKSSNGLSSPELLSISSRAYLTEQDQVFNLPISVSDVIRKPGKQRKRTKGLGRMLHDRLLSMQGESVEVEIFQPPMKIIGALKSVSARATVQYVKGFPLQVAHVTVEGQMLSDTSNLTGENYLGVGMLGIEIMGGVDD